MIPKIIEGNRIFDNRGSVQFNNDLKFQKIKRFYVVHNYSKNFVRAWHGHLKEEKYISCTKGTFQISAVQLDKIKKPGKKNKIFSFIVNENDNKFIHIPKGYANGTMSFEDNSKLLIFSTSDLNESINDDYRYESTYWDPWTIHER
tara:strand:+ start:2057 stop:2494 length:438 start_codon:yes stop_codon:yes gene_type:complete